MRWPWLRAWQQLFDLLGDLLFFHMAWRNNEFEVREAWSMVKSIGQLDPLDAYHAVFAKPGSYHRDATCDLAVWMQSAGYGKHADTLWAFIVDYYRQSGDADRLMLAWATALSS